MSHLWFKKKRVNAIDDEMRKKKLWKKIKVNINIEAYQIVDISTLNTLFNTHHFLELVFLLSLFKLSPYYLFKMTLLWRDKSSIFSIILYLSNLINNYSIIPGFNYSFTFNFYFVINFIVNKIICHILPLIF